MAQDEKNFLVAHFNLSQLKTKARSPRSLALPRDDTGE